MSLFLFPVSGWEYIPCSQSLAGNTSVKALPSLYIGGRASCIGIPPAVPGNENNENMYEITLPKKVQSQQPGCCLYENEILLKYIYLKKVLLQTRINIRNYSDKSCRVKLS